MKKEKERVNEGQMKIEKEKKEEREEGGNHRCGGVNRGASSTCAVCECE